MKQQTAAGRVGGLVVAHLYGSEHFRNLRAASRCNERYGASDAAQRQWLRDMRAKRTLMAQHGREEGARRWQALVARHAAQFGRQVAQKGNAAS